MPVLYEARDVFYSWRTIKNYNSAEKVILFFLGQGMQLSGNAPDYLGRRLFQNSRRSGRQRLLNIQTDQ